MSIKRGLSDEFSGIHDEAVFDRLSTFMPSNLHKSEDSGMYRITVPAPPSVDAVADELLLSHNADILDIAIDAGILDMLDSEPDNDETMTGAEFIRLWRWDEGRYIESILDPSGLDFEVWSDECCDLLNDKLASGAPLTLDVMTASVYNAYGNYDWETMPVGELAFTLRRFGSLYSDADDGTEWRLNTVRRFAPSYTALAWDLLGFSMKDTEELVTKVRSFDIAHQYVEAGIDDVQTIIRAVENGIDASILLSFSPSLSEN
jgi:hypothetical protein